MGSSKLELRMKSLLILALAGLACSYQPHHQYFATGQEYVYNYSGRILTGIPQIDSTFAGMSMEGQVIVQATSQNSFKMMMRNVKFGTFNDHLSGSSQQPTNWRNVQLESSSPLTSQYQQYMESPVEFTVEQGQFSTVKLNSEEPQWAVNFKKALVASIKVQQPKQSSQLPAPNRRNPRFWNVAKQDSEEQYYWTTMEEGMEGKCGNTYHVSELPEYMVTEYERGMLRPELCQGKKYYQVVRTKDMTKCQDRSIYLSSQGHKNCLIGNCQAVNTKQSQTRYYGCGESAHNMELHGMINEGELQHSVVAFNTETVVTGTKQILKLQEEYKQLEEQHTEAARQKLKYCSKKVEQSKSLDYTEFDVTYSSQLPREVYRWAKRTNMGVKAALYQYISYIGEETNQNKITVKLNINQQLNSLSMTVASPEDTTRYTNIRLPYQLNGMIPLVAGMNPAEQGYKALTGQSLMSQCVVGEGYVQTFDQKTYSYQLDECDHVVASDCSGDSDHSVMVLAKEVNGMKHITILSGQTKIQLSPAKAYSGNVEEYQLSVNGQEVSLQQNQQVTLSSQEQITAYYNEDKTVTISTPSSRINHSGKTVEIEEKGWADGSHCGLCGDYNNDRRADLKSPKKCIFKSSELFGKSYRSKSSQCSPLPQETVERIRSEEERCDQYETKRTPVTTIYSSGHGDSYSIKKHSYIYEKDQICISQEPVVQCTEDSIPKSMKKKTIKFVCLPEGRISKLYSERIERGESPQELKHQPVAFTAQMDQPVVCGPSQL